MNQFLVKTFGQGEPLTVLHGWGMNSQVWDLIRPQLEAQFSVTWVDLPGHGFNRHCEAQSLDEMVDLIVECLPEQTHIMAWSLGGLVAQAIYKQRPEKVKTLSLIASTPRFSQVEEGANPWQNAMSVSTLENFADDLKSDLEGTLKRFIALQFMGVKDSKTIQRELTKTLLSQNKSSKPSVSETMLERSDDYPKGEMKSSNKWGGVLLESSLPSFDALTVGLDILKIADMRSLSINCPQHWVFGGRDRLIPKAVINDLKSLHSDAQITLLDNAGHAPFMTHPEKFLSRVVDFIQARTALPANH